MTDFSVTPGERSGDRQGLAVAGELDLVSALRLEMAIDATADAGVRHLSIDLSATTFLDSTGLAAIMEGRRRLTARGGSLVVTEAGPNVRRVLELTGLDGLLMAPGAR
jgi:anti-anti-sigma factor